MESTQILKSEFEKRRLRNPSYSLRAFARDLNIGVASLSDFFAGKRSLSKSNAIKIAGKLLLSQEESQSLRIRGLAEAPESQKMVLEEDRLKLISDWRSLAVLNLARLPQAPAEAKWIAWRLGIDQNEAEIVLNRLIRLKMLKKVRGKLHRTIQEFQTTQDIPSTAIKRCHADLLDLSKESLIEDSVEIRDFKASVVPVNMDKLPQAKAIIDEARKKITRLLSKGHCEQVYALTVQLFPLTKVQQADKAAGEPTTT